MSLLSLAFLASSVANASGFCEVNDPGSSAFIRNSYVELGLGSEGAFGEGGYPSGWHYRSNSGQLGFVANPQADGWSTYFGDFFSPGSPLEGWGLEVGGTSYTNFNGSASIPGSLGDPACEIDICGNVGGAVDWTGALGDLGITTQYGVVNDSVFIVMTVTLTNNGTSTLSDVYWFRNVDPDNSVMRGYGYSTTNTIISQPNEVTDLASVRATGGDGADLYLMASDSRARVTHGGFYNSDASDIWNGSGFYSSVGSSATDDAAVSLAVRIGDMAPGQTETFRVIYALDETAVVSATDCAEAPVEPDGDGDGTPDAIDACPNDPLNDADGDGICGDLDACEGHNDLADADGDYIADGCDTCPNDPLDDEDSDGICGNFDICPGHSDLVDSDGDTTPDGCDICVYDPLDDEDDDTVCGNNEICPGSDDLLDTDMDFMPDGCDTCPFDALGDSDADGSCDSDDICPGADDLLDTDGDAVPNGCDTCPDDSSDDSDGDGSCNSADICPGFDDFTDSDSDGLSDDCDTCPLDELNDVDGDGVCGDSDICPSDSLDDRDGDGICESADSCPLDADNDADEDGNCGDVDICPTDFENDADADGFCADVDTCPGFDDLTDTDLDGVADGCDACPNDAENDIDGDEKCADVDPCPFDPLNDADDDGVCDGSDSCLADPTNDSDNDGICGLTDNCPDYPNDEQLDYDGDRIGDFCDPDADGDGAVDAEDNCFGEPNDQSDVDGDGIGDACDPVDDRPVDTGDTGDTGADTAVDTGETGVVVDSGDSADSGVDTSVDTDPVVEDTDRPAAGKYIPGGCSTTGTGGPSGGLILLGTALLASVRRRGINLMAMFLGVPLLMGASGGEVPEMSVVPLPPRGAAVFKGEESAIVGGVVTDPLSYLNPDGTETVVIGDTYWGWTTNRYTFDHFSFDVGLPGSIAQDGVPRVGDAWAGARGFTKAFGTDGWGAYGDLAVVVPTGIGLGVAHPTTVVQVEAGAEGQIGGLGMVAGGGYLVYPDINLEGYELGDGPYLNAVASYGLGDFTLGLDTQAFYNVGENPVSSLFVGTSVDWAVGNFSVGVAGSKGIIRQPGDPEWQLSAQLTFGPTDDPKAEVVPAQLPPPPPTCDCKSVTVYEQPIVIVVPEKVDPVVPPKQEIGIGFKAGDSTLTPKAKATLDGVWVILNSRPGFGIKVVGYSDAAEIEIKHPEELSYERAKIAADYLISKGISTERISVEGKGDSAPIDASGTPEGRALNRRVEFVVIVTAKPIE
jgi:outer membrane protein OmpA-like peptidoglycan-associated protein